jgi:hypothetical protein
MNMVWLKGRVGGGVIIPSGPVSLPRDRELLFQVEPGPRLVSGQEFLRHAGRLDRQTADEMTKATKGCERIDGAW